MSTMLVTGPNPTLAGHRQQLTALWAPLATLTPGIAAPWEQALLPVVGIRKSPLGL